MREIEIITEQGETITVKGRAFTGLLDRNGVKIFEGSKVKFMYKAQPVVCEIIFNNGMFCLKWSDGYINQWALNPGNYEVVNE